MGTIDARGKSCPQPVIMTKSQVEAGERDITVLLDSAVSASNVRRYLETNGYRVQIIDDEGSITITATGATERPSPVVAPAPSVAERDADPARGAEAPLEAQVAASPASAMPARNALLITKSTIGDDSLLGEVLMKSMLGTLGQVEPLPYVVALMNEGVKLALNHTSSLDHLLALERGGVRILVCGTCTNHFGITADIGAGVISNMFEITEALLSADKILSL